MSDYNGYEPNGGRGELDRSAYEYHYTYRPQSGEPAPVVTLQEVKPRRWPKVVAAVLIAALLMAGAFALGWFVRNWTASGGRGAAGPGMDPNASVLQVSSRKSPEVETVSVTGTEKLTYAQVYAANVDACVSINVSGTTTSTYGYNYFGRQVPFASSGSGFIITKDGYIVTNYHVIDGGSEVKVTLNSGETYEAEVIGGDKDNDLAVLKVDPGEQELKPVVIGSTETLLVGDEVLAIGNPLGELTFSLSEGIVSCLDRKINVDGTPLNMIQITAAVNSGNSGGPLFNLYGEVVGIVSAKYSSSSSYSEASVEGLGFAIPIDDVLGYIKDIMENGQITSKPYLGIMAYQNSNESVSGVKSGVYIESVDEGGPADKAGLKGGDVITMIGIQTITSRDDISTLSRSYAAGDTVTVTYVREGKVHTTELTLGSTADKPAEEPQDAQQPQQPPQDGYGYGYEDSMQEFLDRFFGYGW